MTIKPVPSGSTSRAGSRRPVDAGKAPDPRSDEATRAAESKPAQTDNVQFSDAVKELHGQVSAEPVPSGELTPERLGTVLDRLAKGHYDRPEVKDQVVERLAEDVDPK